MRIGVPKELKNQEFRVGLTPHSVKVLTNQGHEVFIESNLGAGIGYSDETYASCGGILCNSAEEVFSQSELIVKVKEPLDSELSLINEKHTLFTFFHLAGNPSGVKNLLDTGSRGIAYETVTNDQGGLPLLSPMSAIAGQISLTIGNYYLLKPHGGKGVLSTPLDGLTSREVTVLGAGVAGCNAIKVAVNQGSIVNVIDLNESKLNLLKSQYGAKINTFLSNEINIQKCIINSDIVVGSVYVIGKQAPKVILKHHLSCMQQGSIMIDISIDQGGCFESSVPTTHDDPVYRVDDILHYCVTNMPGAVPLTASEALNKATLPFIESMANRGIDNALDASEHLRNGLNFAKGRLIHPSVIESLQ
ncbi:MAG: alanine dehydrogenase [Gammaproteobacteria bacterium]